MIGRDFNRGDWVAVGGTGFDPSQQFEVLITQGSRRWTAFGPASPRGDRTFLVPVQIPAAAQRGSATVAACIYLVRPSSGLTGTCAQVPSAEARRAAGATRTRSRASSRAAPLVPRTWSVCSPGRADNSARSGTSSVDGGSGAGTSCQKLSVRSGGVVASRHGWWVAPRMPRGRLGRPLEISRRATDTIS